MPNFLQQKRLWWKQLPPITRTVYQLLGLTLLMFGFTFSLIPLYSVFCTVTGMNGKIDLINQNDASQYGGRYRATGTAQGRLITIEFDTTVHPDMPFEFVAQHTAMQITPGALNHTSYYVKNKTNRTLIIQAIPSISPGIVARYLKKLECFCFSKQTLRPHEEMYVALRFWLEPEFPDNIHRLTLSYTLFDVTQSGKENNS